MKEIEMLLEDGKVHNLRIVDDCVNCPWLSVYLVDKTITVECTCNDDYSAPCNEEFMEGIE